MDQPFDLALWRLREKGWRVAVHNDYRLGGVDMTFWLMTHPDGRYFKGEGRSDLEALLHIERQIVRVNQPISDGDRQ